MKKILLGFILCLLMFSAVGSQGLDRAHLRSAFYSRIGTDTVFFPTVVVDSIYNIAAEIVSAHGLAYFRIDTVPLLVGNEFPNVQVHSSVANFAIWPVGMKLASSGGSDEVAWSSIDVSDAGKGFLSEITAPSYYWWWGGYPWVMEFTSWGVYPKPTVADTAWVYYYAFTDVVDSTGISSRFEEPMINTALCIGYIRKGQTDIAVSYWNLASVDIDNIRQQMIGETKDMMIVPKIKER